jgi:serpin B
MVVGLLALMTAVAVGCGAQDAELRSPKERAAPAAADAELKTLAQGNNAFAFSLYRALSLEQGNLFYSPYSISLALAMTYGGARGETESQMADTLQFPLAQDRLHPTFNALDRELATRGKGPDGKEGAGFTLNLANAVWGQEDYAFLDEYLDLLAESYGAGVRPADFRENPEESRIAINDWVAERTEGRIEDLIPPGIISELTRMVLTNAIYFNAGWQFPFEEGETRPAPFHLLDGSSVEAPMMRTQEGFGYANGEGYQAVDLPYVGYALSMTVLLPDMGRFREFEDWLDAALVERIIEGLEPRYVDLQMPRFAFESQFLLSETLKEMGMAAPFDPAAAEFSGMDGKSCLAGDEGCLYIKEVVHKAFVSVNEAGTEAAAATAVVMQTESAPPQPVAVTIDRPFIFLIRDRGTDTILFVGRVERP